MIKMVIYHLAMWMTSLGRYNFLNNIREKSIWEATKAGAKKVGAMSISAINMISFEIVKAVVTNQEVISKIVAHIPWAK